jgi:hypothetical protein
VCRGCIVGGGGRQGAGLGFAEMIVQCEGCAGSRAWMYKACMASLSGYCAATWHESVLLLLHGLKRVQSTAWLWLIVRQ